MKTNREKFLELVSDVDIKTEEKNNWLIAKEHKINKITFSNNAESVECE